MTKTKERESERTYKTIAHSLHHHHHPPSPSRRKRNDAHYILDAIASRMLADFVDFHDYDDDGGVTPVVARVDTARIVSYHRYY